MLPIALANLLLGSAAALYAQAPSKPLPPVEKIDLAVHYVEQRSIVAGSSEAFWSEGGSMSVGANLWHGLGPAVDLTGSYAGSVGSSRIPLSLVTTTFGARYRWHGGHPLSMYGQALAGVAHGFGSVFPASSGTKSSASSLALLVGGGVDVRLSTHFSARAINAAWLRTQLPNSTDDVQNNLQLSAGIVFNFGR